MSTDLGDLAETLRENDGDTLAGMVQIKRDRRASKLRHEPKFDIQHAFEAAFTLGIDHPDEGNEFVLDMLVGTYLRINLVRIALKAIRNYGDGPSPEMTDDFAIHMLYESCTVLGSSDVWRISESLRSKQETAYSEGRVLTSARDLFNIGRPLGENTIAYIDEKDVVMKYIRP